MRLKENSGLPFKKNKNWSGTNDFASSALCGQLSVMSHTAGMKAWVSIFGTYQKTWENCGCFICSQSLKTFEGAH